jgi:hypothetical protein
MSGSFLPAPFVTTQVPPRPVVMIDARASAPAPKAVTRDIWHLASPSSERETPHIRARQTLARIAAKHGVDAKAIRGPRRSRPLVDARFEAYDAVVKICPEWSYPDIGMFFNKDHTTILSAIRKGRISRKPPARVPTGDQHPSSRLTDDQAREIKRRALSGESTRSLAREFGVCDTTTRRCRDGHRADATGQLI